MVRVRETETDITIRCPACGYHCVPKGRWTLSGTTESPTITPSINETVNPPEHKDYRPGIPTTRCHSVIENGKIRFCNDSTHKYKGQTLELPAFEMPEAQ